VPVKFSTCGCSKIDSPSTESSEIRTDLLKQTTDHLPSLLGLDGDRVDGGRVQSDVREPRMPVGRDLAGVEVVLQQIPRSVSYNTMQKEGINRGLTLA
jgi:hypothetical protein